MDEKTDPKELRMGMDDSVIAVPFALDGRNVPCMPVARDGVRFIFPLELVAHLVIIPYEWMEISMIKAVYDKDDRVIEGGAGIGLTTAHLAREAEKVWGYEPLPDYAELALQNCNYNEFCHDTATIVKAALGLERGEAVYHRRYLPSASSGLPNDLYSDQEEEEVRVEVANIDEEVELHQANALHLDVEGSEHELIMNMNLEPLRKITMETHPTVIGEENTQAMFEHLEANGLKMVGMAGRRNYPTHNYAAAFVRSEYRDEIRGRLEQLPEEGNETAS